MTLPLLLAYRFISTNAQEKSISFMIKICFISIALASCALALVSAIMQGFETATYKKLQGINADVTIRSSRPLDPDALTDLLSNQPGLKTSSPMGLGQVIVQQKKGSSYLTDVMLFFAIDPERYGQVSDINQMLVGGIKNIKELHGNNVVVGQSIAKNLSLKVGDWITLLYPETEAIENNRITLSSRAVQVAGFFNTGIEEFDEHTLYGGLELFEELFSHGITQFVASAAPGISPEKLKQQLTKSLHLSVQTWQEQYPALLAALTLEKYVSFLVLSLMALLACMTIIAVLFMLISQKKNTIAILKAMGMKTKQLVNTFILLGTGLSFGAALVGIIAAWLISILLTFFPIPLPQAYYTSHLPIILTPAIMLIIIALITCMGFFASWYPAQRIKNMLVTDILKQG